MSKIRKNEIIKLKNNAKIQCPICNRLLHFEEEYKNTVCGDKNLKYYYCSCCGNTLYIGDDKKWNAAYALTSTIDSLKNNWIETHSNIKYEIKPKCSLIGHNGNVYDIIKIISETLTRNNQKIQLKEFLYRLNKQASYSRALELSNEYVEIC